MDIQEHTDETSRLNGAAPVEKQKRDASQANASEVLIITGVLADLCTQTFPNGGAGRAKAVYKKGHDDDTATEKVLDHSKLNYSDEKKKERRSKVRSRLATLRHAGYGRLAVAKRPSEARARWDRLNQKATKHDERLAELEHGRAYATAKIATLETAAGKDHKRIVDVYYALNKLAAEFKALQKALGDDTSLDDIPA